MTVAACFAIAVAAVPERVTAGLPTSAMSSGTRTPAVQEPAEHAERHDVVGAEDGIGPGRQDLRRRGGMTRPSAQRVDPHGLQRRPTAGAHGGVQPLPSVGALPRRTVPRRCPGASENGLAAQAATRRRLVGAPRALSGRPPTSASSGRLIQGYDRPEARFWMCANPGKMSRPLLPATSGQRRKLNVQSSGCKCVQLS